MNIHFALYDPSFHGHNYWTWKAARIPQDLLDALYYDALITNKPMNPNNISEHELWGGMVLLKEWIVVYRYYNGGRDTTGRPGRYVILTGWVPRNERYDGSLLDLFHWGLFEKLAQSIPPCPCPKPCLEDVCITKPLELGKKSKLISKIDSAINSVSEFEFLNGTNLCEAVQNFLELSENEERVHLLVQNTAVIKRLRVLRIPIPQHKNVEISEVEPVKIAHNASCPHTNNAKMQTQPISRSCCFNKLCFLTGVLLLAGICVLQIWQKKPFQNYGTDRDIESKPNMNIPKSFSDEDFKNLYEKYFKNLSKEKETLEKDWKECQDGHIGKEEFIKKHPEIYSLQIPAAPEKDAPVPASQPAQKAEKNFLLPILKNESD